MGGSKQPKKNQEQSNSAHTRFQRLLDTLRTRICLLDYPPGTRLSEEALAEEFGVSRTPLRRVLAHLAAEGLVKVTHGVGTLVTDIDFDQLSQVYQLRMELAELIGKISPVPPSEKTIEQLRSLLARSRELQHTPDPRAFARLNVDFFQVLTRLTESTPLREITERLYYQTSRIWLKSISQMDLAEEVAIFSREIVDVLTAVEIGDLGAVGHIWRSHISMSHTRLKNSR
ncbi:MAG: DNA-binding GntR family transcriptional regulator [Motiliproteus sp.]|jgi:DNA-binding GntR family transcriptional regulator